MSHESRLRDSSSRGESHSRNRQQSQPTQLSARTIERPFRVSRRRSPLTHHDRQARNHSTPSSRSLPPSGPRALTGAPPRRPGRRYQDQSLVTRSRLLTSRVRDLLKDCNPETALEIGRVLGGLQNELICRFARPVPRSDWSTDAQVNFQNTEPGMIIETVNCEPLGDPRGNPIGSRNRTETLFGPMFTGLHPALVVDKHRDINGSEVLTVAWCGTYGGRAPQLVDSLKGTPGHDVVAFIIPEDSSVPEEIPRDTRTIKAHTFGGFMRDGKRYTLVDFRKVGLVYCHSRMRRRGYIVESERDEVLGFAHRRTCQDLQDLQSEGTTTTGEQSTISSPPRTPTPGSSPVDHRPEPTPATGDINAAETPGQTSTAPGPSDMTKLAHGLFKAGMSGRGIPGAELSANSNDQGPHSGKISVGLSEQVVSAGKLATDWCEQGKDSKESSFEN
ncbi:hypothetical protein PRZ48_002123 [Zasmidium cellare]|uniref:Uncharacterized protein n=1 Tax=Zasmidium cellare TaxID=395010 RepID=A0ABR0F3U1_ZASCE|nr:hypothetical protein PRZ48_002123 [Zasmidium cellare]